MLSMVDRNRGGSCLIDDGNQANSLRHRAERLHSALPDNYSPLPTTFRLGEVPTPYSEKASTDDVLKLSLASAGPTMCQRWVETDLLHSTVPSSFGIPAESIDTQLYNENLIDKRDSMVLVRNEIRDMLFYLLSSPA